MREPEWISGRGQSVAQRTLPALQPDIIIPLPTEQQNPKSDMTDNEREPRYRTITSTATAAGFAAGNYLIATI